MMASSMSIAAFSSFSSCRASQSKARSTRCSSGTVAASKSQLPALVLEKSTCSSSDFAAGAEAMPSSSHGFLQKHSATGAACLAALLGLGLFLQSDSASAAEAIQNFQGEHLAQRSLGDLAMFSKEDTDSMKSYLLNARAFSVYLVTVPLGGLIGLLRPLTKLFRSPGKAVLGVMIIVGGSLFVAGTLVLMLDGSL